ncbi:MAG TPA: phosphoribosyltransferase family protein [Vicinamibacterales bacterium]|nr:phosphoribosyltransferase family protein [Vicinamibacterales bacterium]
MAAPQHLGFFDRREAGALLATKLCRLRGAADVVVLAVSRGAMPVAYEIAKALNAPLDLMLARKLPAPGHPEIVMGAIAGAGVHVLDERVLGMCRPDPVVVTALISDEAEELARRERACRAGRAVVPIQGRVALLVDDGLVTGTTMRAAAIAARRLKPARLFIAVPVGARAACERLRDLADEVICPYMPQPFSSAADWFAEFQEPSDKDVRRILEQHAMRESHRLSA